MNRKDKYNSKYCIQRYLENGEEQKLITKYGQGILSLYYLTHLYWLSYFAYNPSINRSLINDKSIRTTKGICPRCFSPVYYFDDAETSKQQHSKVCDRRQQLLIREVIKSQKIMGNEEATFIHRRAKYFKLTSNKLTDFYDFLESNSSFFETNRYIIKI